MTVELWLQTCIDSLFGTPFVHIVHLCIFTSTTWKLQVVYGLYTHWTTALLLETSLSWFRVAWEIQLESYSPRHALQSFSGPTLCSYCKHKQENIGVPATLLHSNHLPITVDSMDGCMVILKLISLASMHVLVYCNEFAGKCQKNKQQKLGIRKLLQKLTTCRDGLVKSIETRQEWKTRLPYYGKKLKKKDKKTTLHLLPDTVLCKRCRGVFLSFFSATFSW